ncbi:unnamed protein product [Protopolystoma xenopodis]|uniref:Neurotransmitter-gated ion-channel ligand-binding domain-containing protein n=1 Tax=Protopolystoma xenopodis TaxID=117903 RepID=A0A448XFB5_9PLAT|nr:unnamed protein product [Protopolystoma xenopodis]
MQNDWDGMYQKWLDFQLTWDPSEFDGLNSVALPSSMLWKPDIVLFNNADGKYEVSWNPNIIIHDKGETLYVPPSIYKSSCEIDVNYFPFDQQTCDMEIGSWTYNSEENLCLFIQLFVIKQVNFKFFNNMTHMDLTDYVKSGSWDIVDTSAELRDISRRHEHDETTKEEEVGEFIRGRLSIGSPPKKNLFFTVVIRRKPLFYSVNLIVPCVLIALLSVCVFYLPSEAGEKVTLSISILLALVVFLLLVSKILPANSVTLPLISKFLLFTFSMNFIAIVVTVVIINWNHRSPRTHPMPPWVHFLFIKTFPKLLFLKRLAVNLICSYVTEKCRMN